MIQYPHSTLGNDTSLFRILCSFERQWGYTYRIERKKSSLVYGYWCRLNDVKGAVDRHFVRAKGVCKGGLSNATLTEVVTPFGRKHSRIQVPKMH